jgi:hypothetical protein
VNKEIYCKCVCVELGLLVVSRIVPYLLLFDWIDCLNTTLILDILLFKFYSHIYHAHEQGLERRYGSFLGSKS